MRKSIISNNTGISFAFAIIVMALLLCTSIYIVTMPIVNVLIDQFNSMIADDMVSIGTQNAFNFGITLFKAIPIFALIGFFLLYPITIALLKKRVGE